MRTPLAVIAVLLVVLTAIAFATDEEPGGGAGPAAAPVEVIARRVEQVRSLRFRTSPRPVRVSPETARREGLADLDRGYPAARREADETLYELLGLFPAGTDLRKLTGSVFGEGVGGYYDPRDGRLRIVEGVSTSNRVMTEVVVAHELTHALEDQRFGLATERLEAGGDGALAYQALVEGTATAAMSLYLERHFRGEEALGGLLASAFAPQPDLPPFLMRQLLFPYEAGARFVSRLREAGGGGWRLVDLALRVRPPASTEQVLHEDAYLRFEAPMRVGLAGVGRALGPGWRNLTSGTFGEWQTGEFVALAGRARPEAVDGWGGDRYELWRHADGRPALVLRWLWDSARDEREFWAALRDYVDDGIEAEPAGEGLWRHGGGFAAVRRGVGAGVTLAFAPEAGLAQRLAGL